MRVSHRVSAMWSTVKCPKCETRVPVGAALGTGRPSQQAANVDAEAESGTRWSFIWTPPRGDFCPECDFPLSKYFGRLKWIRTMMVGVAIVILAFIAQVIGAVGPDGPTFLPMMRQVMRVGAVVFGIGVVGIIIPGKHGPDAFRADIGPALRHCADRWA